MPRTNAKVRREAGRRRRLAPAHRRALIMEAAARVFADRGYSGAAMTDIAAAAGISPSVIYDHFPSKRDLHLALLDQHGQALIEATFQEASAALTADASSEELARSGTDAFFRFVEQDRYAWRMLFRDPPADDEIAATHARIHGEGAACIAAMIRQAPLLNLPAGIPRDRAEEMMAWAIKSSNDRLAVWWYEHPELPRKQVVEIALGLWWRGLAAAMEQGPDRNMT